MSVASAVRATTRDSIRPQGLREVPFPGECAEGAGSAEGAGEVSIYSGRLRGSQAQVNLVGTRYVRTFTRGGV